MGAARAPARLDIRDLAFPGGRCSGGGSIDRRAWLQLEDNRMENDTRMTTRDIITEKLTKAFQPESLKVVDESHRHEGHAGWRPGGETHYRLYIVSSAFQGKSRVERHRMINEALARELQGGVHALAIHASAPGEALGG
jgi:BolA protein